MSENATGKFTCVVCGKEYHMCRKCSHSKTPFVAWRATACCPECYAISEAINAHYYGRIDAKEAKRQFEDAGWDKIDHMLPDVHEYIEKVMKEADSHKTKTVKEKSQSKDFTADE